LILLFGIGWFGMKAPYAVDTLRQLHLMSTFVIGRQYEFFMGSSVGEPFVSAPSQLSDQLTMLRVPCGHLRSFRHLEVFEVKSRHHRASNEGVGITFL
jgi:hypothetical protein